MCAISATAILSKPLQTREHTRKHLPLVYGFILERTLLVFVCARRCKKGSIVTTEQNLRIFQNLLGARSNSAQMRLSVGIT
jgi:hypothetical protein